MASLARVVQPGDRTPLNGVHHYQPPVQISNRQEVGSQEVGRLIHKAIDERQSCRLALWHTYSKAERTLGRLWCAGRLVLSSERFLSRPHPRCWGLGVAVTTSLAKGCGTLIQDGPWIVLYLRILHDREPLPSTLPSLAPRGHICPCEVSLRKFSTRGA